MEADARCACFHVLAADDEHGVGAEFFRVGDFRLEGRGAEVGIHAHLTGREPEREVACTAGAGLDAEADEALTSARP